jgi:hypothetical protein
VHQVILLPMSEDPSSLMRVKTAHIEFLKQMVGSLLPGASVFLFGSPGLRRPERWRYRPSGFGREGIYAPGEDAEEVLGPG